HDRLLTRTLITADDAMNLERWHAPDTLHRFERLFSAYLFQVVRLFETLDREAAVRPVLQLLFRRRNDVVVETFDLHFAGAHVVEIADELYQLGDRITRRAASFTGVRIDA